MRRWTPEARKALSRAIRKRWRAGAYAGRRRRVPTDEERAAARARMKALNIRMRDDERLKAKCVRGMRRVRRTKGYREIQAAVMRNIMSRPELRRAARWRIIAMNRDPRMRKRQWAGRRRRMRQRKEGVPIDG